MVNIGTTFTKYGKKALLCGSGELGKEVAIELQRYGVQVVAVDKYEGAPAMQVANSFHVIPMLDGRALREVIEQEKPDVIIPEIEAIATDTLVELENEGYHVVPTAKAARLTMNREGIRRLAAETLGLPTSPYRFASDRAEFDEAVRTIGMPCVVKPVMSSSGHGQSVIRSEEDVDRAYQTARENHVCFMVAQVLRFWPEYELLKEIYDTKKYGNLLSGYMGRLGCYPKWSWDNWMMDPQRSGMVPFDLHIHDLDFLIYAFGTPQKVQRHRVSLPDQDYVHAVYKYPGFFVSAEASWFAAPYPFGASFRFQFEKALVAYEKGVLTIYENEGRILDLSAGSAGDSGVINLPKSDAYAEEIRYFKDCVLSGTFPDKVKEAELSVVLDLLNSF